MVSKGSTHCRDKASSFDSCGKIQCVVLVLSGEKIAISWTSTILASCDNRLEKIELLGTSLYLPYLSFGCVSVVTFCEAHGAWTAFTLASPCQANTWPQYKAHLVPLTDLKVLPLQTPASLGSEGWVKYITSNIVKVSVGYLVAFHTPHAKYIL